MRKTSELLSYFGESISYRGVHYRVQKFGLCMQPYAGKLPDTIVVESTVCKPVLVLIRGIPKRAVVDGGSWYTVIEKPGIKRTVISGISEIISSDGSNLLKAGLRCSINISHIKRDLFSISVIGSICLSLIIITSEIIKI